MSEEKNNIKNKTESESNNQSWSIIKKITFRFFFIYFSLFIPFQNTPFPFWDILFKYPTQWMQELIVWVGANIYYVEEPVSIRVTGSGDTTYDFLLILTIFILVITLTIFWSVLDRKRTQYSKLYYWLTVGIRYYVGLMLINYGLIKIIQLQFPAPSFYRLMEPFGDSSPMGLAWAFLGFSKGYNIFMGVAELMAVFLLFRSTRVFGSIITLMTTMNVMAINYFYDIPVKIVSTHLVLMTLFLLARDIRPLMRFFFTDSVTRINKIKRPIINQTINVAINVFKFVLIGYVFIYGFVDAFEAEKKYGSKTPKPELYGVYVINHFTINGDTITSYKNDKLWKSIAVSREGFLVVRKFNDSIPKFFRSSKDSLLNNRLKLTNTRNPEESFQFDYEKMDSTGLNFNYVLEGDTIYGKSKRYTEKNFLLMNRGFHLISEYPFNR
jgi:hypothetical protein